MATFQGKLRGMFSKQPACDGPPRRGSLVSSASDEESDRGGSDRQRRRPSLSSSGLFASLRRKSPVKSPFKLGGGRGGGDSSVSGYEPQAPCKSYATIAECREAQQERVAVERRAKSVPLVARPPGSAFQQEDPRHSDVGLPDSGGRSSTSPGCFREKYAKGELIGTGSTGLVYAVKLRSETAGQPPSKPAAVTAAQPWRRPQRLACKEMKMEGTSSDCTLEDAMKELDILTTLRHPNLVHVHDYFIEEGVCKLVMPRYTGGELAKFVAERGSLPEEDAREATRGILRGLRHMHAHGIVHRDLKLENIMLVDDEYSTTCDVRIIDFGLAKKLRGGDVHQQHTICGSPLYIAPEMLTPTARDCTGQARSSYDFQADVWSCGVILYMMLSGHPPFDTTRSLHHMFSQIKRGDYSLQVDPVWELISDGAKDLVGGLLTVDPRARMSVDEALNHPWLNDYHCVSKRPVLPPTTKDLTEN